MVLPFDCVEQGITITHEASGELIIARILTGSMVEKQSNVHIPSPTLPRFTCFCSSQLSQYSRNAAIYCAPS